MRRQALRSLQWEMKHVHTTSSSYKPVPLGGDVCSLAGSLGFVQVLASTSVAWNAVPKCRLGLLQISWCILAILSVNSCLLLTIVHRDSVYDKPNGLSSLTQLVVDARLFAKQVRTECKCSLQCQQNDVRLLSV